MTDLIQQWRELKKEAYLAQKRHEQLQAQLTQLKERVIEEVFKGEPGEIPLEEDDKSVTCLVHNIRSSKRLDSKALKEAVPSIYEKFQISYTYSVLSEEMKPKENVTAG